MGSIPIPSFWEMNPLFWSTAEEAINLAGWLWYKQTGELNPRLVALAKEAIDSAMLECVKRAQNILENCPELVPIVTGTKLEWPDETKREWIRIFGGEPPATKNWEP